MYHLRILFTCLCALVPREKEEDVLMILPDARKGCPPMKGKQDGNGHHHGGHTHTPGPTVVVEVGGPGAGPKVSVPGPDPKVDVAGGVLEVSVPGAAAKEKPAPHVMPPHVGAIQFDPLDLHPDSDIGPHVCYRRPDGRSDYGLYFLSGEDIVLEKPVGGAPVLSGGRTSALVPTSGEENDISWIADISQLDPAAGVIDPHCLLPRGAAELDGRPRVLTRVHLTGGTLSSAILPRLADGNPLTFGWQTPAGKIDNEPSYRQTLSAGVAYDLPISREEVALEIHPFRGQRKRLAFTLAGRPFGYTLQVVVKNMPLDSMLGVATAIDPSLPDEVDQHFAMYYSLSECPPATLWVPRKLGDRSGAPICPTARFQARSSFL